MSKHTNNGEDNEHNDLIYSKPMTAEQLYRQEILMYVRDEIISPIMPPVKRFDAKLNTWMKSRDAVLINKLSAKHTDELIKRFAQTQPDKAQPS